jgi:3-dehydroquinate dehydratase/shikimate dehydrogenase
MMAEHRHLVEQGAELVELRLDYINGEVNIKRLVSDRPCPVVVSCRRERDGGKFSGGEEQRRLLLRTAVAEGVEYVDIEEDVAGEIPRFGNTKRVISLHDFRKTPEDLDTIYQRIMSLDPDIIKICTMANSQRDNMRMFRLMERSEVPMVGICMGDIGLPTRILAGRYGAPFTYATFHHERALAPGQLSFHDMKEVFHYDEINAETDVYGVIADPIGHSLSPLIHNAGFKHHKMNRVYLPIRVPREDLKQFIADAPGLNVKGLSVTIPHKESVLPLLSEVDDAVRGIGAANTVVFEGDRRIGHNTDYRAAMNSLEAALGKTDGEESPETSPLKGKTALILGAGGAGMAIAYGLSRRGATVVVSDGVQQKAAAISERFDCRSVEWSQRHAVSADILVNATPVGMHPEVDETPYEKHHLRPSMVVFDAVYNPENTLLIKEARSRNCKVVTGIDMFVRQACLQFQLFTGRPGPADLMRDLIKRAIGPAKYN